MDVGRVRLEGVDEELYSSIVLRRKALASCKLLSQTPVSWVLCELGI